MKDQYTGTLSLNGETQRESSLNLLIMDGKVVVRSVLLFFFLILMLRVVTRVVYYTLRGREGVGRSEVG